MSDVAGGLPTAHRGCHYLCSVPEVPVCTPRDSQPRSGLLIYIENTGTEVEIILHVKEGGVAVLYFLKHGMRRKYRIQVPQ